MPALLLCAGFGKRMGTLSDTTPKPLLAVADRPIVRHAMDALIRAGVTDITINIHHLADQFRQHFAEHPEPRAHVRLLYEEALRGSAGTLAALAKDWKAATSPIYVYYGDIVCDADLAVLGQALEGSGALGAILVHQRQRPQSIVEMAPDGRVTQFLERPKLAPDYQEKHWTFSGIAAFSTGIFERLPAHCPADLPADVFPTLAREGTLVAVGYEGRRVAVDSVERLALANRLWGNPDSGATAH